VVLTTHDLGEAEALADRVAVLARGRVVADGSRHDLRARIESCTVCCASTIDEARIGAWPGVRSVRRRGPRLEIVTNSAEATVRRLLHEDAVLAELEVRRAGLAEAFVELARAAA
jgi:ABC-2 type transport system ATP-binding protein